MTEDHKPCDDQESVPCERVEEIHERIENVEKHITEIRKLVKSEESGIHFCIQAEEITELKSDVGKSLTNQQAIFGEIDAVKRSQDRMFKLIENIRDDFKEGNERFKTVEEFIIQKTLTNGHRDKKIEELEKDDKESREKIEKIEEKVIEQNANSIWQQNLIKIIIGSLIAGIIAFVFAALRLGLFGL